MDLSPLSSRYDSLDQLIRFLRVVNRVLNHLVPDTTIRDIVQNGVIEQHAILRHDGDVRSQVRQSHLFDVLPINENLTLLNIVESVEKPHYSRFSGASLPHNPHGLPCLHRKRDAVDNILLIFLLQL